jgi:hypothetical protein
MDDFPWRLEIQTKSHNIPEPYTTEMQLLLTMFIPDDPSYILLGSTNSKSNDGRIAAKTEMAS